MDIKTKIFWLVIGLLLVSSFALTFYRYIIKKDYMIQAQMDCDPYTETCFVWKCDPASDVDGEKCTGDAENDIWYYKLIKRNASLIPDCDPTDENCEALACENNEPECHFILCDETNKEELGSEECTDPIKYSLENPMEEDAVCEEGDAECFNNAQDNAEGNDASSDEAEGEEESMTQTTQDVISSQVVPEDEANDKGDLPVVK
ncbi:MAG: hypothetical protein WC682_03560 [Parcubacteria group bacterium]|jgi:hypothetical protein